MSHDIEPNIHDLGLQYGTYVEASQIEGGMLVVTEGASEDYGLSLNKKIVAPVAVEAETDETTPLARLLPDTIITFATQDELRRRLGTQEIAASGFDPLESVKLAGKWDKKKRLVLTYALPESNTLSDDVEPMTNVREFAGSIVLDNYAKYCLSGLGRQISGARMLHQVDFAVPIVALASDVQFISYYSGVQSLRWPDYAIIAAALYLNKLAIADFAANLIPSRDSTRNWRLLGEQSLEDVHDAIDARALTLARSVMRHLDPEPIGNPAV